jgi:hypothetical protein
MTPDANNETPQHETEGFASRRDMDEWFRPLVKRGETVEKALMLFGRSNAQCLHAEKQ